MREPYLQKFSTPVIWKTKDIKCDWEIEDPRQTRKKEYWKIPAQNGNLLFNLYKEWNIPFSSMVHKRSFNNEINFDINEIFSCIPGKDHEYNFLLLSPGHIIPWHHDSYRSYVKKRNVLSDNIKNVKRALVMMNNWKAGQVIQFRKEMYTHWNAGDIVTWDPKTWHGAANFGNKDLFAMIVDYQI